MFLTTLINVMQLTFLIFTNQVVIHFWKNNKLISLNSKFIHVPVFVDIFLDTVKLSFQRIYGTDTETRKFAEANLIVIDIFFYNNNYI